MNFINETAMLAREDALEFCRINGPLIEYNQAGKIGHYFCIREPIGEQEATELGMKTQQFPTTFWIPPQPSANESEPNFVKPYTDDTIEYDGDEYVVKIIPTDTLGALYQCKAIRTKAHHLGVGVV